LTGFSKSIYISRDLHEQVKREAEKQSRTYSQLVRLILEQYFKKKREVGEHVEIEA